MTNFVLKPKVSEKTYELAERLNTYVFEIPKAANKHAVAKNVAAQYGVGVVNVRLSTTPGKTKRSYRRGGRNVYHGQRSDIRRAYVTLAEGDKLPIFSAVEEETAPKDTKEKK